MSRFRKLAHVSSQGGHISVKNNDYTITKIVVDDGIVVRIAVP